MSALSALGSVSWNLAGQVKRSPMFARFSKHWNSIVLHATPRKVLNALWAEVEFRLGRTQLQSRPYIYFVDPINVCNLRCPLCPTGSGNLKRPQKLMDWETFTRAIDAIAPYAFQVRLYNWGEPTLHPHIYDMIRYVRGKNIGVVMSSNLVRLTEHDVQQLVESGLEYLTVSIDGATQDVYSQYRVRGDLEAVLKNLRAILAYRRSVGRTTPFVEWQFIVMKHNEHQIDQARQLAKEIGVDVTRFIPVGLPFDAKRQEREEMAERWMASNPRYRALELQPGQKYILDERCFYLYRSMTINPEGAVAPCCIISNEKYDFGDIRQDTLDVLWNNERYRSARNLYTQRRDPTAKIGTVCHKCPIYRKSGIE